MEKTLGMEASGSEGGSKIGIRSDLHRRRIGGVGREGIVSHSLSDKKEEKDEDSSGSSPKRELGTLHVRHDGGRCDQEDCQGDKIGFQLSNISLGSEKQVKQRCSCEDREEDEEYWGEMYDDVFDNDEVPDKSWKKCFFVLAMTLFDTLKDYVLNFWRQSREDSKEEKSFKESSV